MSTKKNHTWRYVVASMHIAGLLVWCYVDQRSFWPFMFCGGQVINGLITGVLIVPAIMQSSKP